MSHPKDRRHRFLIGVCKGQKRAMGYWPGTSTEKDAYLRRNTTKLCSCPMCGNPRRKSKDKLTMQEKRQENKEE